MPAIMMALATTVMQPIHAAERAPWVVVRLHPTTLTGTDPAGIWSKEEIRAARRPLTFGVDVEAGSAEIADGEVVISRLEEPGCNAECPVRVVLRRPGKPDAVLLDDYVYVGTPASPERGADMIYRVCSDLSELDGGTGTDGKAVWPGGRGGVLALDRSALK